MNRSLLLLLLAVSSPLWAAVTPIGEPLLRHGITFQPLFIQAVSVQPTREMEKMGINPADKSMAMMNMGPQDSDMHLEVAIHAAAENPHGFPEGGWIPYMKVFYKMEKLGDLKWGSGGLLMPMAAANGPHYGANIKLGGPGKYRVRFTFLPPSLPYHMDKETGISGWWDSFHHTVEFSFFGTGKLGGY